MSELPDPISVFSHNGRRRRVRGVAWGYHCEPCGREREGFATEAIARLNGETHFAVSHATYAPPPTDSEESAE